MRNKKIINEQSWSERLDEFRGRLDYVIKLTNDLISPTEEETAAMKATKIII